MMIPQVAERLIAEHGHQGEVLFDPYCGTGTSLLEAKLAAMSAVGTDLNPLARLIARTKTAEHDIAAIEQHLRCLDAWQIDRMSGAEEPADVPVFANIGYWFAAEVQQQLADIAAFAEAAPKSASDFFRTCFSETVRRCSWAKNSEFKLLRMNEKERSRFRPDPYSAMSAVSARNLQAVRDLAARQLRTETQIWEFDTVAGVPAEAVPAGSVDLVVTSPPYGDSRTTVAYGQFSRLSSQWLGLDGAAKVDRQLMGGGQGDMSEPLGVPEADKAVEAVACQDIKRGGEVASFLCDYRRSIENVAATLKSGGVACYVVGNRTVKGVQMPTDDITAAFMEQSGLHHIGSVVREIPSKRMPYQTSPSNKAGVRADTMRHEIIVSARKQ